MTIDYFFQFQLHTKLCNMIGYAVFESKYNNSEISLVDADQGQ